MIEKNWLAHKVYVRSYVIVETKIIKFTNFSRDMYIMTK